MVILSEVKGFMENNFLKESIVENKSKNIIKISFVIAVIIISFFIIKIFEADRKISCIPSIIEFIRLINSSLAIISVMSSLILYKKTKDSRVFTLTLIYVGLAIAIMTGQSDYFEFLRIEFNMNNYVSISTSLLRMIIIYAIIFPNSKTYKFINKHRITSLIFVVMYYSISGAIEQKLCTKSLFLNKEIFAYYNILLFIAYSLIAIKLCIISIKESKVIIGAFSISLFLFAVKSLYSVYELVTNDISINFTSILITYIAFFVIIFGTIVELYLLYEESKHLNQELKKFYNLANYNSHTYMFICDDNLNISYMNNKIKEEFGYDIDNATFKEKLLCMKDVKESIPEILVKLEIENNWRGIIKDVERGEVVDCFIQCIHSDKGKSEILVSYIDISDHIRLESEIQIHKINDIKKSEFISILSHELKTPLNIFYSTIQLLDNVKNIDKDKFIASYNKHENSLKLNCKRMLRLINNIIDTTKIDSGVFKPEFGNYEIVSIVEDIALSTVAFAEAKNINIRFDTDIEEHYIKCDPTMIEKIILNLLSNSIKYSYDGGKIKIDLILCDDMVKIIVEDSGIGIPNELKDKIFDKFLRGDSSLKRLNEGSGIGLSIVKAMVEIHEGNISVDSGINIGSVFQINIPNKLIEGAPMRRYEFNTENTSLELSDIY